jgi:hypothetical protein
MQFNAARFAALPVRAAAQMPPQRSPAPDDRAAPGGPPAAPSQAAPGTAPQAPQPPKGGAPGGTRQGLVDVSQNLLKHVPGEASGFYLLAVSALAAPSLRDLGLIFALSLVLLIVVRWLAQASWGIMLTTIGAFVLWMLIFDKGFLHVAFPDLLPGPLGLIVALFYSTLITLLASAGKIR